MNNSRPLLFQIPPPFTPTLSSECDTRYFDPAITGESFGLVTGLDGESADDTDGDEAFAAAEVSDGACSSSASAEPESSVDADVFAQYSVCGSCGSRQSMTSSFLLLSEA